MSVAALEMAPVEMVPVCLIDVDGKNLRREKGDVSVTSPPRSDPG